MAGRTLLRTPGGELALPAPGQALVDAADGGHLVVHPPRPVWERSELAARELANWSFLVAAAGRAMLDELPQLAGGCVNYWEAGNWALHDAAEPRGAKAVERHRRVHLHLLGRSRAATSPDHRWGESPRFPEFAGRLAWTRRHARLAAGECARLVAHAVAALGERYATPEEAITPSFPCAGCGYPTPRVATGETRCAECAGGDR